MPLAIYRDVIEKKRDFIDKLLRFEILSRIYRALSRFVEILSRIHRDLWYPQVSGRDSEGFGVGFFFQNACFRDSRDSDHFRDPGFLRETRVLRDSEGSGGIREN